MPSVVCTAVDDTVSNARIEGSGLDEHELLELSM